MDYFRYLNKRVKMSKIELMIKSYPTPYCTPDIRRKKGSDIRKTLLHLKFDKWYKYCSNNHFRQMKLYGFYWRYHTPFWSK